jgi:hypothetical protein
VPLLVAEDNAPRIAAVAERMGISIKGMTMPEAVAATLGRGRKPVQGNAEGEAYAVANHGRWIVRCPFVYAGEPCTGAERASRNDPRFWCCECANFAVGGKWLPVVWPESAAQIELVLSKRAAAKTRNWEAGEPLTHLLAENEAHGVGDGVKAINDGKLVPLRGRAGQWGWR